MCRSEFSFKLFKPKKLTSHKKVGENLKSFSFDTKTLKTKYFGFYQTILTQKIDTFLTFKSWIT